MSVQSDLPKVESDATQRASSQASNEGAASQSSTQNPPPKQLQSNSQVLSASEENMQSEAAVAHECVEAWRIAVQQKDEATAMKMLEKLAAENPHISTVRLMMGQVKDYFKKHDEALVYYRKAYAINKFSSIQTLRLASSLRKNGQFKEAESHYDRLLKNLEIALADKKDENLILVLASVRTGKAACLSHEGKKEEALAAVKKALTEDPGNLEAKELLKNLGG
ncbi:MAG: tetratricopeptide repeat protein [Candidatus Melainabacteria bacterium]|nr:tetratricopeptide repeat protein [Candidatus Melainabacteria bacterium]